MDFKRAFHTAYLLQQRITEVTDDTIFEHSIDSDRLVLMEETERCWIIRTLSDGQAGEFINVVLKDNFEMDSIEVQ